MYLYTDYSYLALISYSEHTKIGYKCGERISEKDWGEVLLPDPESRKKLKEAKLRRVVDISRIMRW